MRLTLVAISVFHNIRIELLTHYHPNHHLIRETALSVFLHRRLN